MLVMVLDGNFNKHCKGRLVTFRKINKYKLIFFLIHNYNTNRVIREMGQVNTN